MIGIRISLHNLYRHLVTIPALIIGFFFIFLGLISFRVKGNITEPSIVLSLVPFYLGERARSVYYKVLLKSVGRDVTFKYGTFCQYRNTIIGNRVGFGYFNSIGEVNIGDHVMLGGNVNLLSGLHHHAFNDPDMLMWDTPGGGRRMIHIGSDVWIGSNSVIGADIGNRCVIGAGSVVIKPVEDHSLVGGNPAKLIRTI